MPVTKAGSAIPKRKKQTVLSDEELQILLEECKDVITWSEPPKDLFSSAANVAATAESDKAVSKKENKKPFLEDKYREPGLFKGRPQYEKPFQWQLKEKSDVTEWSTYFDTVRTVDEIREKILTDFDNVCFSYMCLRQKLPEEFIPELMALSTGLLAKDNYSKYIDSMIDAVLVIEGIKDGEIDLAKLPTDKLRARETQLCSLVDRLDWNAIRENQTYSAKFRKEFEPLFNDS